LFGSKARITAMGSYVPERILTNHDLESMVDTNDEWIVKRTGIKERRMARENEFTSDLGVMAVKNLIGRFNKSIDDVDLVIVCTITADYLTPSTASQVQAKLGLKNTGAIDVGAACAGFVYGLHLANGLITSGLNKKVLVVGAETMTKIMDYNDRTTCILFGDGAGAALVEYDPDNPSFISSFMGSQGEEGVNLYCTNLSQIMDGGELSNPGLLVQNGREVFKWVASTIPKGMLAILDGSGVSLEEVDWFVPHSANLRIIEHICDKSGFPLERTLNSIVDCGNTSSATIPLALVKGIDEGKLKQGDKVLLYGFGAGLVHAGLLINWTM
jgi:3-oxoacyl-[acyl-carrier-protein] synthase III